MGPVNNDGPAGQALRGLMERTGGPGQGRTRVRHPTETRAWDDGYFLLPAVVLDAQPDDEIVREEQFGPILPDRRL